MSTAFDYSEDWIPLTSVQMARSRRANFRQYGDSGTFKGHRMKTNRYHDTPRRPPMWGPIIGIVIVILLVWLYSSLHNRLQAYTSFTNTTEVAQVTVLKSREGNDQLSIQLTRFDANGYPEIDKSPHLIQGDKVQLKYEYIILPPALGFLGLHSGYILTDLEGYYTDGTPGSHWHINNADEDNSIPAQIDAPLASPKYGNITLMPSRSIHTVYISQTGQLYEPSNQG